MKGKLIKSPNGEHYYLTVDGKIFAEIGGHPLKSTNHKALSLKNCEEIYNGLDISVEVHASCIWTQIDVIDPITHTCKSHISKGDKEEPILDENGCLILKRI